MHEIQEYLGQIVLGLTGVFLTAGITGYKSLMARIKKLEETQIKHDGRITMNEALDEMRDKKS